jgi:hypothetical protein
MTQTMDTDYLVIGAGAAAMAFVDELITQSHTARVIMVDRRDGPGGHWNNAYDFVTLHQPAEFYGVNSERLEHGPGEFASKDQILTYYKRVMDKMCATGRVRFFPQCEYEGDGVFRSLKDASQTYQTTVKRRIVDATYANVSIPSERAPDYPVDTRSHCVPINALASLTRSWKRYIVIGAGKTGIDAILRLLDDEIGPDDITWIMSHDPLLFNRDLMNRKVFPVDFPRQLRATISAANADEYLQIFEKHNWIMRLDPTIQTEHCRCTTINLDELAQLRSISHIVRLGRVKRINADEIILEQGQIPTGPDTLHIDCTANGLERRPPRTVFEGNRITLQPLALCQPIFSAGLIASIEVRETTDDKRNRASQPVPYPDTFLDYFEAILIWNRNSLAWIPRQKTMMFSKRLSILTHLSLWGKLRLFVGLILWGYHAIGAIEGIVQHQRKKSASD